MKCVQDNPEHRLEAGTSNSYSRFGNKGRHPTFQKTSSVGLTELQFSAEPAHHSLLVASLVGLLSCPLSEGKGHFTFEL